MANILIVDDSILMRRNLRTLLQEAGHTVVAEASDGIDAFAEYEKHMPDLVTMDITMPVMNGIDAVKKIIAKFPEAVIIMISALDQKNMVFEAVQSGAKHYILKPITIEKILSTINSVLGIRNPGSSQIVNEAEDEDFKPTAPFSIENKNGVFLISLSSLLTLEALADIDRAVQGFLFIRPLKVIFEFKGMRDVDAEVLQSVQRMKGAIEKAEGTCRIVVNNLDLILRLKNSNAFDKIYTEVSQTIL